jgi:hypothetical protein
MRILVCLALITLAIGLSACGSTTDSDVAGEPLDSTPLSALPADGVQPWEKVDSRGFVIPPPKGRGTSSVPGSSYFKSGAERFLDGGTVATNGDALSVQAGPGSLSYAIYRFPMGGVQPSAYALDVNLTPMGSQPAEYWVGISNYTSNTWQWSGPYHDAQITNVVVAGSNSLSGSGSFFVAVTGTGDTGFDVVGVTVVPEDAADTTPPPVPSGLHATPVAGGLELQWNDVIAGDLAGYQVYWSYSPFSAAIDNGVNKTEWLENTTRMVLPVQLLQRNVYVAISAIDTNGNESALSTSAGPFKSKSGTTLLNFRVTTPVVSAQRGDTLEITASGAEVYDFDMDGDGDFDSTGSASGTAPISTAGTGIIRPRVRGTSADGKAVAFGSVSLIVSGNQRPSVSLTASPSRGVAPLNVAFDSDAQDLDGAIVEYAWDFEGDGIFDTTGGTPSTNHSYNTPGLYNAKLRATDDQGAWDVDGVTVQVTGASGADGWLAAEPRPDPSQGGDTSSLEVVNGNPAIGYDATDISFTARDLMYVRATDASGTSWGAPLLIDPDGADAISMLVVAGNPAMAYHDLATNDLRFVRANDPDGNTWGAPITLDGTVTDAGGYASMLIVGGNPAISYYDMTNGNLRYIRASTANGSTWSPPMDVDASPDDVGRYASMAMIDGSPAIAYFSLTTPPQVSYVRASHPLGLSWGPPQQAFFGQGESIALTELNGLPMMAFHQPDPLVGTGLYVARSITVDGSAAWVSQLIDNDGDQSGVILDIKVIDGRACVAYMRALGEIVYKRAAAPNAAIWGQAEPVGGYAFQGSLSLDVIQGKPAMSFGHLDFENFSIGLGFFTQP